MADAELLLSAVGEGKTEYALQRIVEVTRQDPFARVWVLLATERQSIEFRNRLAAFEGGQHVWFNVEFFTFYELYNWILNACGVQTRQLSEPARLRLLRVLTASLPLSLYGEIAERAGFLKVLADWIYELKGALIDPTTFADVAAGVFGARIKDQELTSIYQAYQARLQQHDIVDREGMGWLALATLAEQSAPPFDLSLLVVDGYDQFTLLQANFVAMLSQFAAHTCITLTYLKDRTLSPVNQRFARTKRDLEQAFADMNSPLTVREQAPRVAAQQRHPELHALSERIFLARAPKLTAQGAVRFIAAPDPASEASAVLRAIKRLLVPNAQGEPPCRPDDVLVVLRDYTLYRAYLVGQASAYGLPMAFHMGEPLPKLPIIHALLTLVSLHDAEAHLFPFARQPLFEVLRSPYFAFDGLDAPAVALLDRISRAFKVTGGAEAWLAAIASAAQPQPRKEDDDEAPSGAPLIDAATAEELHAALSAFFVCVSPPSHATYAEYVYWLNDLIGEPLEGDWAAPDDSAPTRLLSQLAAAPVPEPILSRDMLALDRFKQMLSNLLQAQQLVDTLENQDDVVAWARFWADLNSTLEHTPLEHNVERAGRVLVTSVTDARGLPHAHVFVMGLSEGIFPMRMPENPLYLERELQALRATGLPIVTAEELAGDDGLFYEMLNLAQSTLTLSRPTTKGGAVWVESHLWRATASAFDDSDALIQAGTVRADELPALAAVASYSELGTRIAAVFSAPQPDEATFAAYNHLVGANPALWRQVWQGYAGESARLSAAPHDAYSGVIQAEPLVQALEARLGAHHRWSASQLNDYGICPYRFFAGRVLRLVALEEPALGIDARQLGELNHNILERTYRQLALEHVVIAPAQLAYALEVLHATAESVLVRAPQVFGFRESAVWAQEKAVLLKRLVAFVRYDFTEMDAQLRKHLPDLSERYPYQMETPFGIGGQGKLFELSDSLPSVSVFGYIDRIDRYDDRAIVMDYKTSQTLIAPKELDAGRNFQIMFYLLATQDILDAKRTLEPNAPRHVAGGFFWHLYSLKQSGMLVWQDPQDAARIDAAREHIARYIQQARAGDFAVRPSKLEQNGRCTTYCHFSRLCRVAVTQLAKE